MGNESGSIRLAHLLPTSPDLTNLTVSSTFQERLQVECRSKSRFCRILRLCFLSDGTFEEYEHRPSPAFEVNVDGWVQSTLRHDPRNKVTIRQEVNRMRTHFEAAYKNKQSSVTNLKIGSRSEFKRFFYSQIDRCGKRLLLPFTTLLAKAMRSASANNLLKKDFENISDVPKDCEYSNTPFRMKM